MCRRVLARSVDSRSNRSAREHESSHGVRGTEMVPNLCEWARAISDLLYVGGCEAPGAEQGDLASDVRRQEHLSARHHGGTLTRQRQVR